MRIVGIGRSVGPVLVGLLNDAGNEVTVLADVDTFWSSPTDYLTDATQAGQIIPVDRNLVPPVISGARVLCVGLNYQDHVDEGSFRNEKPAEFPTLFARWSASLTVDGADVPVPTGEDGLDWEGEVVAWIGSTLVDATPEEALAAVVGYSTFNDITSRRAQKRTSQWIMGKNGDRSGPLGPMIPASEVGDLRDGLRVVTRVNGEVVQHGNTSSMIYGVGETLSLISRSFTLNPGDLLATGTPSGVGYSRTPPWLLQPGDTVKVEVDRLGILTNRIVDNVDRHARVRANSNAGALQ
ncbi:fumarylacetoacetate hydrolase family protein [Rhodococcus sp. PAMC28707]|uniref:fumarylacetoacetate hydrolase family protein n=1 Tax=unclassified Rhodococcus (in: high G+C Gram-positive bacteria) TaxID=192944 RepID=UPI00109E20D1|nr:MULTISPECIES: fumarylacetoacetate hydrolase family protein [unclassified Rhodococcus (in: high G+C Gram-positive bacteria)]QCB51767.1 fumarylacetoacetate hydrolase family protein [Rhodococcus sp. PAMC28705]QCB60065.1 fumarylacetoacetate hydrolase family protein [Rhodococcus sp. PAMC28707]